MCTSVQNEICTKHRAIVVPQGRTCCWMLCCFWAGGQAAILIISCVCLGDSFLTRSPATTVQISGGMRDLRVGRPVCVPVQIVYEHQQAHHFIRWPFSTPDRAWVWRLLIEEISTCYATSSATSSEELGAQQHRSSEWLSCTLLSRIVSATPKQRMHYRR